MSVENASARVTAALSRAESLFAGAADNAKSTAAAGLIADVAKTARTAAPRASEVSGAMATAHGEAVSATADRLDRAAGADNELARHLDQASDIHTGGRSYASSLRASAAEIPAALGPATQIPAGQVAALRALRNRVARMHDVVTSHSADAGQLAEQIRNLGYRT
jgi:Domain of unknown function (DUF4226)